MTTNTSLDIGSTSITTLGTISSGIWNGTSFAVSHGGTNNTTFTAYSVICAGTTATGTFQNVSGVGTAGQVLTSNGASALPTWQGGGSGGLSLIQAITASNQATVEFDSQFTSSYNTYLFTFTNVQPVSATDFLISQVGTGAGPTWVTTAYNWFDTFCANGSNVNYNNQNDSSFALSGNTSPQLITNASAGYNGYLYVYGANGTSNVIYGNGHGMYLTNTNSYIALNEITFYHAAATYTSIKFYFSGGNVNSGTIRMYGINP